MALNVGQPVPRFGIIYQKKGASLPLVKANVSDQKISQADKTLLIKKLGVLNLVPTLDDKGNGLEVSLSVNGGGQLVEIISKNISPQIIKRGKLPETVRQLTRELGELLVSMAAPPPNA